MIGSDLKITFIWLEIVVTIIRWRKIILKLTIEFYYKFHSNNIASL